MTNQLITIIVAVFNGNSTIQKCIESIFDQTYINKELIVIDGGSNDGTLDILVKNQDKFNYWVSEPDRGIFHAWNKGLVVAKGEWICFLGADDYFQDHTVLERLSVRLHSVPDYIRIVYGRINLIGDSGESPRLSGEPWEHVKESFKQYMCLPHVGMMHRKSLFELKGNFNESFKIAGDYEFLLRELKYSDAFFVPDIVTVCQRLGGISTIPANRIRVLHEVWRAQRLNGQLIPQGFLREELLNHYFPGFDFSIINSVFNKLTVALNLIFSFKSAKNRSSFRSAIRDYMKGVKLDNLSSTETDRFFTKAQLIPDLDYKVLLIVHEFSLTGSPYAVLYLARAIFSINGVKPLIISAVDGPLRKQFETEKFNTIVDPYLFNFTRHNSLEACEFLAKFERVIVTSLAAFDFVRYFRGVCTNLTWWIHETQVGFGVISEMTDLSLLFAACDDIWLGSPLCYPLALKYAPEHKLDLLLYGCSDIVPTNIAKDSQKIIFSIFGTVEQRKGQDVFVEAIAQLAPELRKNAVFQIVGSPSIYKHSIDFYNQIRSQTADYKDIEFYDNMPLEKLHEFYAKTDVFVSASRDDPMPIVITEGLMFSKTCLCSSAIGQAQLLQDGVNGLIFADESVSELADKMNWILQNKHELTRIGKSGRVKYEEYFLMSSFINHVKSLMNKS